MDNMDNVNTFPLENSGPIGVDSIKYADRDNEDLIAEGSQDCLDTPRDER